MGDGWIEERKGWAERHAYCMVCWRSSPLETHEIIGGSMRSMEPCNYARLCRDCHDNYHFRGGDSLELKHILYCKFEWSCFELGCVFTPNCIVEGVWNWHRLGHLYRPSRRPVSALCLPSMEFIPSRFRDARSKSGLTSDSLRGWTLPPLLRLDPEAYSKADADGIALLRKHAGPPTCLGLKLNPRGVPLHYSQLPDSNSIFSSRVLTP